MISPVGVLKGHRGWITAIAAPAGDSSILVTASRDKTLIKWDVSSSRRNGTLAGVPVKSLVGHSDFVQDVQVSSEGAFALSGSWDNTLALWDLNTGTRRAVFRGHTNDVTTVAFSPCNRQIVSGSRDRSIRVWNTIAECKGTLEGHSDWVSCVRFSPGQQAPTVVSGGYDGKVKVWSLSPSNWGIKHVFDAHPGYVSSLCISPDGSLCATGGKDGIASLWDLNEYKELYTLSEPGDAINAVIFSPNRYWLTVAAVSKIRVYDLESRDSVATLTPSPDGEPTTAECISLAWSNPNGQYLYSGWTDGLIRVWRVSGGSQ